MEKGRYSVVLYNTLGQRLYNSTIDHIARSGTYTISLGRLISKGTYTLHISKGETTINERVWWSREASCGLQTGNPQLVTCSLPGVSGDYFGSCAENKCDIRRVRVRG